MPRRPQGVGDFGQLANPFGQREAIEAASVWNILILDLTGANSAAPWLGPIQDRDLRACNATAQWGRFSTSPTPL
jgi:hypothetical protein